MEKVIDLKDLLKHEIVDLYSAEEQIIEALPLMIEKAVDGKLKEALEKHLKITEEQKSRLDEVKELLTEAPVEGDGGGDQKPGFFSRLFGNVEEKCKGMEGLITEGKKLMSADMSPEAADAAIIGAAQKIEHYEISGYGTARAYARELKLDEIAGKLEQTLNEEYTADDLLTQLAVGQVNVAAEFADGSQDSEQESAPKGRKRGSSQNGKAAAAKKGGNGRSGSKAAAAKKGSQGGRNNNAAGRPKAAPKKAAAKKTAAKKGAPKKAAAKKAAPKKSAGRQGAGNSKAAAKKGNTRSSNNKGGRSSNSKSSRKR